MYWHLNIKTFFFPPCPLCDGQTKRALQSGIWNATQGSQILNFFDTSTYQHQKWQDLILILLSPQQRTLLPQEYFWFVRVYLSRITSSIRGQRTDTIPFHVPQIEATVAFLTIDSSATWPNGPQEIYKIWEYFDEPSQFIASALNSLANTQVHPLSIGNHQEVLWNIAIRKQIWTQPPV